VIFPKKGNPSKKSLKIEKKIEKKINSFDLEDLACDVSHHPKKRKRLKNSEEFIENSGKKYYDPRDQYTHFPKRKRQENSEKTHCDPCNLSKNNPSR